ncbi:MAG: hypothetical protein IKA12_00750, partial [Clostridia bacterium]|nr:hypothetical protein [Clostridia bacterium]
RRLRAIGMFFGGLFGLMRGRDRAILRLVLVVLSAVLAFALRGMIVDIILNINVDGATLQESLLSGFGSEEGSMPEGLVNLIFALLEIVIGFAAYFILLFVLRFLTWLLLFPFLKLIVRAVEKKRARKAYENSAEVDADFYSLRRRERKKLIKKQRNRPVGALIGMAQGLLLAFFLFAPLTGLVTQVDKVTSIKIEGESLVELPAGLDFDEYSNSFIGKFYITTGGWMYEAMTTTTDDNGNEVSLDGTLDSVSTLMEVVDATSSLQTDLEILGDENATPNERIIALNNLGDKLISVGNSMSELDDNTMDMITDLITEMGGEDVPQDELDEMLEMLTPEFFLQAGNGIKALASYEQIKLDGTELTQAQATDIINKAYEGIEIVGGIELDIKEEHKPMFKSTIEAIEGITAEDKDTLFNAFGIED